MKVTINSDELQELRRKAELYDKMIADNTRAGKISAARMTPERRRARAKKAVEARIKKYSQNTAK
jgi:hypothetical protein